MRQFVADIEDMDAVIDEVWAEPIELHPWTKSDIENAGADTTRAVIKTEAVRMGYGPNVIAQAAAGGGNAQTIAAEVWISVRQEALIIPLEEWRQGDRIYFPDRDLWMEISWPAPSGTYRPEFHLVRINE